MANAETSHSENNKRIAKNTLLLYVRMLFSLLISIYNHDGYPEWSHVNICTTLSEL